MAEAAEIALFITWLGQSAFLIEANGPGPRILMDPFGPKVGYTVTPVKADIVTVSHEHFDHNCVQMAEDSPLILRGLTGGGADWANVNHEGQGVKIRTVRTFHDAQQGAERGKNAMFVVDVGGLRLVHSGDLGHLLSPEQVAAVGRVDVLFLCVGGKFTIGPEEAKKVARDLKPRVVIPMHYKTPATTGLPLQSDEAFVSGWDHVVRAETARFPIPKDLAGFPEGQITVLCLPYRGEKGPS